MTGIGVDMLAANKTACALKVMLMSSDHCWLVFLSLQRFSCSCRHFLMIEESYRQAWSPSLPVWNTSSAIVVFYTLIKWITLNFCITVKIPFLKECSTSTGYHSLLLQCKQSVFAVLAPPLQSALSISVWLLTEVIRSLIEAWSSSQLVGLRCLPASGGLAQSFPLD